MKKVLIFLFFVIFIKIDIQAQWILTNGIGNNQTISFVQSGTNLFAGTKGGVFISIDNGSNWSAVNNGLTNLEVREMAVTGSNLFASTWGGGVFLSTDNGANWTGVNNGLTQTDIEALLIDGNNLFAGTALGVFLSTDNGANWTEVSSGLPFARHVKYLAKNGNYIFAGTIRGVYRTDDNGTTWVETNTGLPPTGINSFAMMGDSIFVATDDSSYTGVYVSTDFGITWTSTTNSGLSNNEVYEVEVSGTDLFAGTSNGIFFSADGGANWVAINDGLTNFFNLSLFAVDNSLFVGMEVGTWRRQLSEVTAVEDNQNNLPVKYKLYQNYPNPFNPTTTINYSIAKSDFVTIKIFNVLGKEVKTLVNRLKSPGKYQMDFDAGNLTS